MAKKILTVDDSKTMREKLSSTLEGAGYDVTEAGDGADALRVLEGGGKFDLIITDLNMPAMGGLDLIAALRGNPDYRCTPILVLTTGSDPAKKERGKAAGATDWIVKPFNPEELVKLVRELCP